MKLPDKIAVMPLPNAVLFPSLLLPLHIFEPRYRQMLGDCLSGDRMFAVTLNRRVTAKSKRCKPCDIAGLGFIRVCVGRPDGTSHLVLQGLSRVKVVRYLRTRPYRVAQIEPLEEKPPLVETNHRQVLRAARQLARARAKMGVDVPKPVLEAMDKATKPGLLADLVSYTMLVEEEDKQRMLEILDVRTRLAELHALLQQQLDQCKLWNSLQGKLKNKDVGHN